LTRVRVTLDEAWVEVDSQMSGFFQRSAEGNAAHMRTSPATGGAAQVTYGVTPTRPNGLLMFAAVDKTGAF
jgi:hypothetical protein